MVMFNFKGQYVPQPLTIDGKYDGLVAATPIKIHNIGHDNMRGEVHPCIKNPDSFLLGHHCSFAHGTDTQVGGNKTNHMFVENGRVTGISLFLSYFF
jgi:hypothetical protein